MNDRSFTCIRGSFMIPFQRRCRGFSLIELLVVLVIVTILGFSAVTMIGSKSNSSVRSVMDEIEAILMSAPKSAAVTARDVYVSSTGIWVDKTLILDARPLKTTVAYPAPAAAMVAGPSADTYRLGSGGDYFQSRYGQDRDHLSAGVDTSGTWYTTALGSAKALKDTDPLKTNTEFTTALGNRLFTGSDSYVIVNGLTKRFEKGFYIAVVGLSSGSPIINGPIGVIVVPANSASIYKFYKPDNSTTWRRM